MKRAGLRYSKFHSTRHTFITWAAEGCETLGIAPAPILAVRDWAGHSSVQETERYFHRVNRRAHARHVDGLDRYVQGDGTSSKARRPAPGNTKGRGANPLARPPLRHPRHSF